MKRENQIEFDYECCHLMRDGHHVMKFSWPSGLSLEIDMQTSRGEYLQDGRMLFVDNFKNVQIASETEVDMTDILTNCQKSNNQIMKLKNKQENESIDD